MLEITPEKAFAEISSGQSIGIDVRESDEWSAGRAPKVSWNPKSAFNLSAMPKNQRVILICRSGNRSGQLATEFADQNKDISNMAGGMKAWKEAGLPMECDSGIPEVI